MAKENQLAELCQKAQDLKEAQESFIWQLDRLLQTKIVESLTVKDIRQIVTITKDVSSTIRETLKRLERTNKINTLVKDLVLVETKDG